MKNSVFKEFQTGYMHINTAPEKVGKKTIQLRKATQSPHNCPHDDDNYKPSTARFILWSCCSFMEGPNQKQRSLILTQGVIVGLSGGDHSCSRVHYSLHYGNYSLYIIHFFTLLKLSVSFFIFLSSKLTFFVCNLTVISLPLFFFFICFQQHTRLEVN